MAFTTRLTLLNKIKDGESVGWEEFEETYKKLVFLRARDRGLKEDEKDDLLQNVLLSLFKYDSVFRFKPEQGRFRDYLKKIIDRQAFALIRSRKSQEVSFENTLDKVSLSSNEYNESEKHWEQEWQNLLLEETIEIAKAEVSPVTYEAFKLLTLEEMEPQKVAEKLGISMESVYVAKHRFIKRLKPIFNNLAERL